MPSTPAPSVGEAASLPSFPGAQSKTPQGVSASFPKPKQGQQHDTVGSQREENIPRIYSPAQRTLMTDTTTGPSVDAKVSRVDDFATLEVSSSGSSSGPPRNDPAHQCDPWCEPAVDSNPFLAGIRCRQTPARRSDGSTVETSQTRAYALDRQSRQDQEGHLPYTSDTMNLSNPPTNVNTPRLGTPDTYGSEAAPLESNPTQASHIHQIGEDTVSSINSWTRKISEALRDEHIPGRAERTGRSERDQGSGIQYSRVARPKSDASDSLPDTATPSDTVDGAEFDALEIGPLSNNVFADITSRPSLELLGSDDADSTFGEEHSSSDISVSSSVMRHEWKNERRYHSYQSEQEQERLDILHHVFLLALDNRLFLAPINPHLHRILDVGTGTGIWGMEVADLYPSANVKGLDLSLIQPTFVPPNLKFVLDDVEQDWDEPVKYDLIHCRNMVGSIKDWPRLVRQMYDSLKPGGWIELQGFVNQPYSQDESLPPNNPLAQLMDGLREAGEKRGRSMEPAPSFKHWVESTGFVVVNETRFELPVGTWPKDQRFRVIGAFMAASFRRGVGGLTAVPFRDVLCWSLEEVEVLNASVRQMVGRRDIHPIFDFIIVTGMKPSTRY
ncbi:Malonyl-[acyl-carrier protein] O-methyltransferase 1 [Tolypocladium ophioglossoides CBS 100239]|uniref:Malonyl-[acyl-carrier protein] O-methyltransferase 1 n=1 Tax=Tolypocladium ophioglossoides (strain CBS 100239) TaxID=1163406 RepID=A0A0L0N101_TOLOC|nr:Malonyl-[acyl-carrier protein] O-methyltransferase 1 [Tolypocladium ophioglossoides CBS 100239]